MKKINKILNKNSFIIFWKSKWLFLQFILLLFIALCTFFSIFFSNVTLAQSYNNVLKNGHVPTTSVQNIKTENSVKYNFSIGKNPDLSYENNPFLPDFYNEKNTLPITANDVLTYSNIKIYNPMVENVCNNGMTLFGFYNLFDNNFNPNFPNINTNGSIWPYLIYQPDYKGCINVNTSLTPISYKNDLKNLLSFYKNGIQPKIISNNYIELFQPSNYAYNPFKIFVYNNAVNVSPVENVYINGVFDDENNKNIELQSAIYSDKMASVVNLDYSLLTNTTTNELNTYWANINLNKVDFMQNLSTIPIITNKNYLSNYNSWVQNFPILNDPNVDFKLTYLSNGLYEFQKNTVSRLFEQSSQDNSQNYYKTPKGFIKINYQVNLDKSFGITQFFLKKFKSNQLSQNDAIKLGFDKIKPLLMSTMLIPLIPHINLDYINNSNSTIKNDINNDLITNWSINTSNIKNIIDNALNKISIYIDSFNNSLIGKLNDLYTLDPNSKISKIYMEYLYNFDIESFIKINNIPYTITDNTSLLSNGKEYIISKISQNNINQFVTTNGNKPNSFYYDKNLLISNDEIKNLIMGLYEKSITYEQYVNNESINQYFSLLKQAKFENPEYNKEIYSYASYFSDRSNYMHKYQWENYKQKLVEFFNNYASPWVSIDNNFISFAFSKNVASINGLYIDIDGKFYFNDTFLVGVQSSYSDVTNNNIRPIDFNFLSNGFKLPYYAPPDAYKNNINHWIYNPYTKQNEYFNSFYDFLNRVPNEYKTNIAGTNYIVTGIGDSPEFIYPIQNSNQFIVNKNVPVIYCNNDSYYNLTKTSSSINNSNIWLNLDNKSISEQNKIINKINDFSNNLIQKDICFYTNDPNQPNKVLYLRIYFPQQLLNIITIVTSIIGLIIGLMSLFFISTLLRSVIKQNINTIGILLANGISKFQFSISLFSFILIPSIISSLLAYFVAFGTYSIINNTIIDYWPLLVSGMSINFIPWIIGFASSFIVLSLVLICVVLWTLRKNVSVIMNSNVEFRMNKFIIWTKPLFSKFGTMTSFRLSYIFGNITRFLLMIFLMTSFMSMINTLFGLNNTFNTALTKTINNQNYNYDLEFETPTLGSGYLYNVPIDEMGTTTKGYTSLFNLNSSASDTPYNNEYTNAISYINPKTNKEYQYTNLSFIDISFVKYIKYNIKFFNNRVWNRLWLDMNVNFLDYPINPWEFAKKSLPNSLISIADNKFNNQVNDAFKYYLYLFNTNDKDLYVNPNPKPNPNPAIYNKYNPYEKNDPNFKYYWYSNVNDIINSNAQHQYSLINDITDPVTKKITNDPSKWNQSNWYYQLKLDENNKYIWKLNSSVVTNGLPSFTMKKELIKLCTSIISLPLNPDYIDYKNKYNQKVENLNVFLSTNAIGMSPNDKTYTYLNSEIQEHNSELYKLPAKIVGININDNINDDGKYTVSLPSLYDENHNYIDDLKQYEAKSTDYHNPKQIYDTNNEIIDKQPYLIDNKYYPLVINHVVAKKYNFDINDILSVQINNPIDKHKRISNNTAMPKCYFKIIGITNATSEEQFYTTQTVANWITGLLKPIYAPASLPEIGEFNYPNYWIDIEQIKSYVPFNGVFSCTNGIPPSINNSLLMFSETGLSPLIYFANPKTFKVDSLSSLNKMSLDINKCMNYNFLPINVVNNGISSSPYFAKKLNDVYGTVNLFKIGFKNLNSKYITLQLGYLIDGTVLNMDTVLIVTFIPAIIIIILLLSYILITESKRLISLLKVFGIGNISNTFTLVGSFFLSLLLSLLISVGITYGLLYAFTEITFTFLNIIISPVAPWWSYFVNIAIIGTLFGILSILTYIKLKNTKPTEVINTK